MSLPLEAPKDWYPGLAISLGEMMRVFKSAYLWRLSRLLERVATHMVRDADPEAQVDQKHRAAILDVLPDMRAELGPLELQVSLKKLDRIEKTLKSAKALTYGQTAWFFTGPMETVEDELALTLVLQMPRERSQYYKKVDGFGAEVASRFPDVARDLEEAHNCLAMARYTATVFHLMRVVEAGLQELANRLGVQFSDTLEWGPLLSALDKAILPMLNQTKAEKEAKEAYNEAMAHARAVKNAWRNPTMHPRRAPYDEDQAVQILTNAKALMQSLAALS